ncbi:MAG: penicillin-binding protein 2 [Firmicutes bacterium]|nr:penicillin-binding protein 2 [Bacillota bacterium]
MVSCAFGYWQLARPDLKVHPLNPRPAARSPLANRGGIFDRHGEAVALTVSSGGRTERAVRSPGLIHVVGYSDPRYGFAGIESAYNADLAGLGRGFGDWLRDPLRMRPQGRDVWLTIDARVQEAAENALGRRPGAVVAVRPRTGEILAMVSYPAYSPAELPRILAGEIPGAPLLNRATQGLYPPGSTFKLVTLAAALEAGLVPTARERATYQRALAVSSNPDFAELGLQLGARELASVASRIGFGARLPLELPANVSPLPAATDAGELAQVSIGQGGLVATPLQMAVAVAAVANGGVVMKPHIVLEVREPSGRLARFTRVEPLGDPAFSVATARAVTEAMVLAVEEGTARQARLPGRRVAGKTGTAENPHGAPHAWFVGFAPAYRPEVAVAVVVENGGSGGAVAAPIGRAVLLAALLADRPPEVSP